MIDELTISSDKTLLDVLKVIQGNGKGIAFLLDNEGKLKGILTDGDIRRALLAGFGLQEIAENVMNRDFVSVNYSDSSESAMSKLDQRVRIIPILDKAGRMKDYYEFKSEIHLPVAIPELGEKELKYLVDAFLSTWISSSGKYIELFEQKFSSFCDCQYGAAVSNGTVALHLALKTLGIKEGDEVIVPDLTFVATINTVLYCNATPVIVDVEKDSWCIDPHEIEKAVTPRTKAIIPVHLYGQPCNMDQIMDIAKRKDLFVIEDCAEAHGACYKGRKVGSFGEIGCFSFYGNKVITTGEGGMCVTNSSELNEQMRILRDHGMSKRKKYWHDLIGYNYRMTNLQAAIGVAQVERIDEILSERKKIETNYRKELKDIDFLEFQKDDLPNRNKITWLVSALVNRHNRDSYIVHLSSKGLETRPFFYSLGSMDIYKKYLFSNKNSLSISSRGINFPTFCSIKEIKKEWFYV